MAKQSINNKKDFEYRRRLSLVRHSIYGVYLSSKNETFVSIHQILNQILILLQYPVCFAIYKEEKESYERIDYKLLADPMYVGAFYGDKVPKYYIPIKGENNLFPMYGTKFYLMAFVVKKVKNNDGKKEVGFYPIYNKKNDDIENSGDYIRCCLQDILTLEHFYDENFAKRFQKAFLDTIKIISVPDERHSKKDNNIEEIDDETVEKLEDIINNSFMAYSKVGFATKLLNGASEKSCKFDQPNIVLFSRSYRNDNQLRKEMYDYDVRLCIPDEQKKDIHQIFYNMKNMGMKDVHEYCAHYVYDTDDSLHSNQEDRKKIYSEFEEILEGIAENDVEEGELISILTSKLGMKTRSFSDPVFSSGGLVHMRFPVEKSGLVGGGNEGLSGLDQKDKLRVILAHYLFESIAPRHKETYNQLALILIPVEIGGTCWGVMAHIIKIDDERGQENLFQSQNTWSGVFNFYQHVAQRVQRDLRRDLLKNYLDVRFKDFKDETLKEILYVCESWEEAKDALKRDSENNKYLERYFPFSKLEIHINEKQWEAAPDVLNLDIELHRNSFFPEQRARDSRFLDSYLKKEVSNYVDNICKEAIKEIFQVAITKSWGEKKHR